ncbi:hypothetical protein AB1Y20_018230 [Prymnesium parvum]|uniref:50S ribosomal protein L10 n=1 Tax=Prymnesium parvum TaxID=97485 RepID=A0AB34JPC1_PRYPA
MPLNLFRLRKELVIDKVKRLVAGSPLVGVAYVGNLSVHERQAIEREMRRVDVSMSFAKNTLTRLGLERAGLGSLAPLLRGTTAIVSGPADVATALALQTASKKFADFAVLGALLHGERLLDSREVEWLSKLPPADVVHGNLVAQMLPGSVLQVPNVGALLVAVLQAREGKPRSPESGD